MLFYPLYYDIISLTSLKITQAFYVLLGFAENPIISWYFKIQNSVRITEGSDNGDLDNQGSTVHIYVLVISCYKDDIVTLLLHETSLQEPRSSAITMSSKCYRIKLASILNKVKIGNYVITSCLVNERVGDNYC